MVLWHFFLFFFHCKWGLNFGITARKKKALFDSFSIKARFLCFFFHYFPNCRRCRHVYLTCSSIDHAERTRYHLSITQARKTFGVWPTKNGNANSQSRLWLLPMKHKQQKFDKWYKIEVSHLKFRHQNENFRYSWRVQS